MKAPDINLLEVPQTVSRHQRAFWTGAVAACLLIGGYWGQAHWQAGALQRAIDLESARLTEIRRQRQRLQSAADYPIDQGIQEARLAEALSRVALELQALAGGRAGTGPAASAILRALARQASPEISLTGIHVNTGAGRIHLQGEALRPEAITRFLTGLTVEPAMAGVVWRTIAASRIESAPWKVAFSVESVAIVPPPPLLADSESGEGEPQP